MEIILDKELDEFCYHKNRIFVCDFCGKRERYVPNRYGMGYKWTAFYTSDFPDNYPSVDFCSRKCEDKWIFHYRIRTEPFPTMFRILFYKILNS